MTFAIITLFPQILEPFFYSSIIGRAVKKKLIKIRLVNLRDFGIGPHKTVDEKPFGGRSGMIIKPDVAVAAIEKTVKSLPKPTKSVLLTPTGKVFNQKTAESFSKLASLLIFCGHYEGVDERVTKFVDEQISIGDFVLTGGEAAAVVIVDAVSRQVFGVLPKVEKEKESFGKNLLAAPVFTRPENFRDLTVPKVLLSGNTKEVVNWRKRQQILRTKKLRPDLFEKFKKLQKGQPFQ